MLCGIGSVIITMSTTYAVPSILFKNVRHISSSDEDEWRKKQEKDRALADRRDRLRRLLQEDEMMYQREREQKYRESRGRTVHHHFVYPEVCMNVQYVLI